MDEALKERPASVVDGEVGRIKALEARIASPELQGLDDAKYWPRMALMDELFDLRHARCGVRSKRIG